MGIVSNRVLQRAWDKHCGLIMVSNTFVISLDAVQDIQFSRDIGEIERKHRWFYDQHCQIALSR